MYKMIYSETSLKTAPTWLVIDMLVSSGSSNSSNAQERGGHKRRLINKFYVWMYRMTPLLWPHQVISKCKCFPSGLDSSLLCPCGYIQRANCFVINFRMFSYSFGYSLWLSFNFVQTLSLELCLPLT
jgi:hypothetical protein